MFITFLLIMHGICALLLVGASTHQALGVFWPRRPGQTDFVANARGFGPRYLERNISDPAPNSNLRGPRESPPHSQLLHVIVVIFPD